MVVWANAFTIPRFIEKDLEIVATGVTVRSRTRPPGHVSESRQVRYNEAEALGLDRGRRREPSRRRREERDQQAWEDWYAWNERWAAGDR